MGSSPDPTRFALWLQLCPGRAVSGMRTQRVGWDNLHTLGRRKQYQRAEKKKKTHPILWRDFVMLRKRAMFIFPAQLRSWWGAYDGGSVGSQKAAFFFLRRINTEASFPLDKGPVMVCLSGRWDLCPGSPRSHPVPWAPAIAAPGDRVPLLLHSTGRAATSRPPSLWPISMLVAGAAGGSQGLLHLGWSLASPAARLVLCSRLDRLIAPLGFLGTQASHAVPVAVMGT